MFGSRNIKEGERRPRSRGNGDPVRRIDWGQCSILPYGAVEESPASREDIDAPADVLSALEQLFEHVVFEDTVPLYIATLDGRVVHVNDGYRQLAAGQRGNWNGGARTDDDNGQELPDGLLSVIKEVELARRSVTLEEKVRVGDRIRHYRSRHFPITDNDGQILAVGGTYVDCTAQAENLASATTAQQRFRDFARASSDWFWETDRDGCLTMLSDRLTAVLGLPAAGFLGSSLREIGTFVSDPDNPSVVADAMRGNRSFREQIYEMKDARGETRIFCLSGVPLFDPETGDFVGYRGAGMDVTDRVRVEREAQDFRTSLENTLEELTNKNVQLDMASAEAANALRVKNEFLAAMSHELRTPLNAIIGFAEAMSMEVFGDINDHYKSYSKDILGAGRHLLGLINDVLDVAVLDSNRLSLDLEDVTLSDVVNPALNLIIMRANKKDLDTSKVMVSRDWTVRVDMRRAIQILVNLFSNAVKFTPEGGTIGIDVEQSGSDQLAVTVWDTGIGIPEDKQALVFEKFQQVTDNVYSRREEGTGLGLHISRQLARLMGGDIILDSRIGEGSRFTVLLPLTKAQAD